MSSDDPFLATFELMFESMELRRVNGNETDKNKDSALYRAAKEGSPETVERLILNGASVDGSRASRLTPLNVALRYGQIENAKTLIRFGAKTDIVDTFGKNLLDAAMYFYKEESIRFILDLNIYSDQYGKLLLGSAEHGNLEIVKTLVEFKSVDVNYSNYDGHSALHFASSKGQLAIVEYLVLKGADLNATDNFIGDTPLFIALKYGQVEVAKALIKLGAKTHDVNERRGNILDIAIHNVDSLRYVLGLGFDIHQDDDVGLTLLMKTTFQKVAREKQYRAYIEQKRHEHCDYPLPDWLCPKDGLQIILYTHIFDNSDNNASNNDDDYGLDDEYDDSDLVPIVKLLLEFVEMSEGKAGMLDYVDYNGNAGAMTALHLACAFGLRDIAKLLLHCGANRDIKDKSGKVPYDHASEDDSYPDSNYVYSQIRSIFDEMQ